MKKILLFLWTGILLYSCTPQETPTTLKDKRDGKVYNTVTIGSQVWMAENLAYLPSVSSPDKGSGTKPHYYVYNFNGKSGFVAKFTTQYRDYGVLYNWAAAMAGSEGGDSSQGNVRGICPEGWHLPSDAEWEQLETYLAYNGYRYANVIGGTVRDKIAIALASVTGWSSSNEEELREITIILNTGQSPVLMPVPEATAVQMAPSAALINTATGGVLQSRLRLWPGADSCSTILTT